ncbi:hypothetical protein BD309DRAFT_994292 [Dichomitus squalens]|uniref:Uncharacterized protein n=1 Tax=Dichomitus squalens TaxID=114155 RepID=A0A4Q9NHK8_9APHY|nr:hypothetical protein BD309DRAFT_994292 [Dichomitus squalens]TBU51678.1 hypothetical protein BD310DRAFT_953143 [Dichomitus squalens]
MPLPVLALCLSLKLNVNVFGLYDAAVSSRLQGVHLLRTHSSPVDAFEGMMASPVLRPRFKALSLGYHNEHMSRERTFTLDHRQYPALEHLCLEGVPIRLPDPTLWQPISSLTRLVIKFRTVKRSPHVNSAGVPVPLPESVPVRRVILHDTNLSLFPPHHHAVALQVIHDHIPVAGFRYGHLLRDRLQGRPTHLQVAVSPDTTANSGGFEFSVTVATPGNAVRGGSNVTLLGKSHHDQPDIWLNHLLSDEVADLSTVREASPFISSATTALRRLPALETVVLVTIDHPSNGPGNARDNIKVGFRRMLEQLAPGAYRYLEHLIVQLSPGFEIEDAETVVGELKAYFLGIDLDV